jgi:hypothetical protein
MCRTTEEIRVAEPERPRLRQDLVLHRNAPVTRRDRPLEIQYQELWFALSRIPWRSLVVVPADAESSAAGIATALANVGRRLRSTPVTFLVMAGSIDYASAGKFVKTVSGRGPPSDEDGTQISSRVIVAVPPVTVEPLALAVIEASDVAVICAKKGTSYLAAAARTVDVIGRDKILGYVVG